jgi:cellulose synthase/poly-beta-1,6-N-acetylglucosamine synthase-like glycosyltransferase
MEKKDYLNISKASDLKNFKDRAIYRFFEILPGAVSLGTLVGVLVFSWLIPAWISIFIICFCFYYFFRVFYFSLHQIISYFKVKQYLKVNWLAKLKKVKCSTIPSVNDWKDIFHIIILPSYKESKELIRETLDSIISCDYPKEKMIIILSQEQRAGKEFENVSAEIQQEYKDKLFKFQITVHPDNIAGEIGGKGSNVAWAGKEVKKLIDELGIPYENILISSFDVDTKPYPQYFACLTYYYLTVENPTRASYQPIPVYNNNIWSAPFFSRVVSTSNTFWQMIQQERAEKLTTYSSHSTPAKVFFEVGYPDNIVQDDSRIFWRAYLYYSGNYRVVPIYYLVSMDAVMAKGFWRTVMNQYKQQRRWAWGCAEIPYVAFGFIKDKKIPFFAKFFNLYTIIDGFWSWATAALLLFALGWLPIFLGGKSFNITVLSFNLPILTGRIMTLSLAGMMVSAILSTLLLPKLPKGVSKWKKISIFLQWIALPVTLILFGSLPAIDAQIRLMLGKHMGFWVTEKVRK